MRNLRGFSGRSPLGGGRHVVQALTACGLALATLQGNALTAQAPPVPTLDGLVTSAAPVNPIVQENKQPGSDLWKTGYEPFHVTDDTHQQIKGYASAVSVNLGETVSFHVTANPPQAFTLDLYRMGYYGGLGGRLMQRLSGTASTQPRCPEDSQTGLIECHWPPTLTLAVPTSWTSGIYLGLLTNSNKYQDYIVFVVRDDARPADLVYQQAVLTYQAYNNYPDDVEGSNAPVSGKSLYKFNSSNAPTNSIDHSRATKVSFDRPYSQPSQGGFLDWDVYAIQWLEKSGYNVTYTTDVDTHVRGERLVNYKAFISGGHDEYWTRPMYDAAMNARDAGVNLAFFGADAIHWQVRLEPSSAGVPNRVVVCYRSVELDPVRDPNLRTLAWRSDELNRPEQTLVGVQYTGGLSPNAPMVALNTRSSWVYADSGFQDGQSVPGIVGYEADRYDPSYPRPPYGSYQLLTASPFTDSSGQAAVSNAAIYQAAPGSRAWVFASGTMSWSWALARPNFVDARIQSLTRNLLDRFVDGAVHTSGGIAPTPTRRGGAVDVVAAVWNTRSARTTVRLDLAIVAATGQTVPAGSIEDVTLEPNQARTFTRAFTIPDGVPAGVQTLVISARSTDGGELQAPEYWLATGDEFFVS